MKYPEVTQKNWEKLLECYPEWADNYPEADHSFKTRVFHFTDKEWNTLVEYCTDWVIDNYPMVMVFHCPHIMAINRPDWMIDRYPGWMDIHYPELCSKGR